MTIFSTVPGISDRAFKNAVKAKLRDPVRSVRLLDFLTSHEKEILFYGVFGEGYYNWLGGLYV
jgi:hypothetical protein